jgi:hypothetical protein
MDVIVTVRYSTDDPVTNYSISNLLENTLPYMVDNVEINFDTEER